MKKLVVLLILVAFAVAVPSAMAQDKKEKPVKEEKKITCCIKGTCQEGMTTAKCKKAKGKVVKTCSHCKPTVAKKKACRQLDRSLSPELIAAGYGGKTERVQELLRKCADPNARGAGEGTPLIAAAIKGHEEIVRLLLVAGADVNVKDSEGWTALRYALDVGNQGVARILVEAGGRQ